MQATLLNKSFLYNCCFVIYLLGLPISKGLSSVAIVGLLLFGLLELPKQKFKVQWIFFLPTLVFFALVVSTLYSSDLKQAWNHLYRQNPMLILPIIVIPYLPLIQKNLLLYFRTFIIANAFVSLIILIFNLLTPEQALGLTTQLSFLDEYIVHDNRYAFGAYSPFIDRLHASYMIGIALLLQLWLLLCQPIQQLIKRWWEFVLLLLLIASLLIIGARGAQLGILLAAIIWTVGIYFYRLHRTVVKRIGNAGSVALLAVLMIVGFVILPFLAYQKLPTVRDRYNQMRWEISTFQDGTYVQFDYANFTSIGRLVSWKNTWQMIERQAILGVGIGDYNQSLKSIYATDDLAFQPNTHNQFLFYWAAAGLLGFTCFLFVFIRFGIEGFRRKDMNQLLLVSYAAFFLLVFSLDAPLLFQVGSMSYWTFYLLLLVLPINMDSQKQLS